MTADRLVLEDCDGDQLAVWPHREGGFVFETDAPRVDLDHTTTDLLLAFLDYHHRRRPD